MSLFSLVSPFYVPCSSGIAVGSVGRIVIPVPSSAPLVLAAGRSDAHTHDRISGEIRRLVREDFARSDVLPVYRLGQRREEALRVERVSHGLGVVLSLSEGPSDDSVSGATVAPLIPFEREGRPPQFSAGVRFRVEALMHSFFFPFARNDAPFVPTSVARLDRLQSIVPNRISWDSLGIRVSDEILALLLATCRLNLGSRLEGELEEVCAILADVVPPEHRSRA
jgi:hypothetical protein